MLCTWKSGDLITAQHLNQMTCAININTTEVANLSKEFSDDGKSSINSSGDIYMGSFVHSGLEDCTACLNRGFIRSGWEYSEGKDSKKGIYVNKSGVENALGGEYPSDICTQCLKGEISGVGEQDIVLKVITDCYGKVISQCITTQPTSSTTDKPTNNLWSGPRDPNVDESGDLSFTRRIGRIVDDKTHPIAPDSSTYYNKVLSTNDLIMPILPARAEKQEKKDCLHSVSLIGKIQDNSVLIKNIANGGGMKFETNCASRVKMLSGVEFHAACVKESEDSTAGGTSQTITWPPIEKHIEPLAFCKTIACLPVNEIHYKWNAINSSWESSYEYAGETMSGCRKVGDLKLQAKSLCGNNWQIGWASTGKVNIPVYDFTPTAAKEYTAGRGINICEKEENIGTEEEPNNVKRNIICNTMKLCAGNCMIQICEPVCAHYKISACKTKICAGEGIKVEENDKGYKISSCNTCFKVNAGTNICVTGGPKCWTVNNTLQQVSVAAGEGIKVTQNGNVYTVSLKTSDDSDHDVSPGTSYSFDPTWFIVTRN